MVKRPIDDGDVAEIRDELRGLILARASAPSVRQANQLSNAIQALVLSVRGSAAGREAVESLLDDPSPQVRLDTALSTLKWNAGLGLPVLEELARRDKGIPGFEAGIGLGEFKAGRLNLDWEPKPAARRRSKATRSRPSVAQLDAVEAVHSTTMSGGFLNSLAVVGPLFPDAIAGYEAIELARAAQLVRKALGMMPPGPVPADHDRRAAIIDGMSDADAAVLESLGGEYQELFPNDDILFDAIEAARGS